MCPDQWYPQLPHTQMLESSLTEYYLQMLQPEGLIKHNACYCRYGMTDRKSTHIILSENVRDFRAKTCITSRQHPQRGICGRVHADGGGAAAAGGKTIQDAMIPRF